MTKKLSLMLVLLAFFLVINACSSSNANSAGEQDNVTEHSKKISRIESKQNQELKIEEETNEVAVAIIDEVKPESNINLDEAISNGKLEVQDTHTASEKVAKTEKKEETSQKNENVSNDKPKENKEKKDGNNEAKSVEKEKTEVKKEESPKPKKKESEQNKKSVPSGKIITLQDEQQFFNLINNDKVVALFHSDNCPYSPAVLAKKGQLAELLVPFDLLIVDVDNFPGITEIYGNVTPSLLGFNHGVFEFTAGDITDNTEFQEWFKQEFN